MAEQTSQEPTMEEILASIRRIISEDEAPEGAAKEAAPPVEEPAPEPEPEAAMPEPEPVLAVAEPEPEPEEDDDALELTDRVETHGDLDVYSPAEPEPAPAAPPPMAAPEPAPAPVAAAPEAPAPSLVSATAAAAAANAFGKLAETVAMPAEGRTLEDVVRELLRPLLQQWLDDHLPAIVQEAVQAEVERIARSRVR
ncbi:DUF2497 domain-containing protein [Phenylobacterium soli]|uniref:DUF2497 domain-containing protein n=1 Tax=Phenylobacterium soli TaxID=2170551 RepID=A0A328AP90_9CAUL|nr:DUF2497 domain-containing protein [Phenylobacterium soli]RAK55666.1 DUF2497 domain-containing protein [Phenylobacterium soli]